MKQEQQHQAERLFFQTDLSKTQIAQTLGISRRTLHHWIRDNNWERLKACAAYVPSFISENCYHIMGQLTEHILSPERADKPVTREEVDNLHKLAITIGKLKNRSTLNESMEMFAHFSEGLNATAPALAKEVEPHIESFIASRASFSRTAIAPQVKPTPAPNKPTAQQLTEEQLDLEDMLAWAAAGDPIVANENVLPVKASLAPATPLKQSVQPPANPSPAPKEKVDLRKLLRGTSTKGPGKSFYKKQREANAAA